MPNPITIKREDGTRINYYLHLKQQNRHTEDLLVILQGSDCNSVSRIKTIEKLKTIYPVVDALTVEKYGIDETLPYNPDPERIDCPAEYMKKDNPYQRVTDLDKVITTIISCYNYKRIILIGGSEGSLVANILNSKVTYIKAAVLFGGGGRFFIDDVIHSMKYSSSSPEELKKNIEGITQFADYILKNDPFEISMSNHGYLWWKTMLSTDQLELLLSIETPVLFVQGGNDKSASPEKASEMMELVKNGKKKNITYLFYPGYDHSLNLSAADNSADFVLNDIRRWLSKELLLKQNYKKD